MPSDSKGFIFYYFYKNHAKNMKIYPNDIIILIIGLLAIFVLFIAIIFNWNVIACILAVLLIVIAKAKNP